MLEIFNSLETKDLISYGFSLLSLVISIFMIKTTIKLQQPNIKINIVEKLRFVENELLVAIKVENCSNIAGDITSASISFGKETFFADLNYRADKKPFGLYLSNNNGEYNAIILPYTAKPYSSNVFVIKFTDIEIPKATNYSLVFFLSTNKKIKKSGLL